MRTNALPPTITRPDRTIHFLTDVHSGQVTTIRTDKILADTYLAIRTPPLLRVHGGDVTNEDAGSGSVNTSAYDQAAVDFITAFTDGVPYAVGIGNHDAFGSTRTAASYCTSLGAKGITALVGRSDTNQVFSLGTWGKAIVIGDNEMPNISFLQSTLDWLELQLNTYATYPCLIFAHPPLKGTFGSVNASDSANPSSTDVNYFSKRKNDADDTYIRTLLGAHRNAKAWISGHCHPHPTLTQTSGLQTVNQVLTLNGRGVAHIIGGAGYHTHPLIDFYDPVWSTYITYLGDVNGGTIEVRHRDCQAHQWVPCDAQLATALVVG